MALSKRALKLHREQGALFLVKAAGRMLARWKKRPEQAKKEALHRTGLRPQPDFESLDLPCSLYLGCGMDYRPRYVGVDINPPPYAIQHDITKPFPLPDESVESILTEETLEHLNQEDIVPVLDECHRLLQPDGWMRIGVPDYGSPDKVEKREQGYDPDYPDHSTLPTYSLFEQFLEASEFAAWEFKHYWNDGEFHYQPLDYSRGFIRRTPDNNPFDDREAILKSSLVVDLVK